VRDDGKQRMSAGNAQIKAAPGAPRKRRGNQVIGIFR
jgi:hypothetical protein